MNVLRLLVRINSLTVLLQDMLTILLLVPGKGPQEPASFQTKVVRKRSADSVPSPARERTAERRWLLSAESDLGGDAKARMDGRASRTPSGDFFRGWGAMRAGGKNVGVSLDGGGGTLKPPVGAVMGDWSRQSL